MVTRFVTLGREEYDAHLKAAATTKRDYLDKVIKQAFEGCALLDGENYWQFSYSFQERKSECGKVLVDEMVSNNHCLIILEGNCKVFKKKNAIQPFRKWREALDSKTKQEYEEILDTFEQNILKLPSERLQLATIGSGELIGAETLLPDIWKHMTQHVPFSKGRQVESTDLAGTKPDLVSLFTVEVSSPTIEYLLVSKNLIKRFFKGTLRKNFIDRFFWNLQLKNRLLQTKALYDPRTQPEDYGARNGKKMTKVDTVRNKIYRADHLRIEQMKSSACIDNPNDRSKYVELWSAERAVGKSRQPRKASIDEKVWKELNDTRKYSRLPYHASNEVKGLIHKSLKNAKGNTLQAIFSNSSMRAQSSIGKDLLGRPRISQPTILTDYRAEESSGLQIRSISSAKNQTALEIEPQNLKVRPMTSTHQRQEAETKNSQLYRRQLVKFIKTVKSLSTDTEFSLKENSLDQALGLTGLSASTWKSADQTDCPPTLAASQGLGDNYASPKKGDYCGRAWRKILASRSSRKSQERLRDEQTAFRQQQSAEKARKAIEQLASFKRSGKDTAVLFTEPVVHLSPVKPLCL